MVPQKAAPPDPNDIRVITTLGHVDHGKTTLMDALLAANNIISSRMAGKMRYLDSREDEQERGITMESSAVSLNFQVAKKDLNGERLIKRYVVNVIDTPGHVDFSSEVSTASRLCDGALVLVDVVEGVCTQTIAVLRQAWKDRLRPILVINKFDRLITELKLSTIEAYHHLSRLIEQVNAVMGGFFASDRMEDDLRWREEREKRLEQKKAQNSDLEDASFGEAPESYEEKDDEDLYFSPDKGNVIFASALDGWGFRIGTFAQLFASKLGVKEGNLRKVLWGDFYLDPKTKKVIGYKHLRGRLLKPLFVQLVLDNLWSVYDTVVLNPNQERAAKIVSSLGLKVAPRELKSKDVRTLLTTIMSQWLSLSTSIIQAVIDVVPAPPSSQKLRFSEILYPGLDAKNVVPKNQLEQDIFASKSGPGACVSAFVSKMFAVSEKDLPERKERPIANPNTREKGTTAEESVMEPTIPTEIVPKAKSTDITNSSEPAEQNNLDRKRETILGFARIYSGSIRVGDKIFCVLPKYDVALEPNHPHNQKHIVSAEVEGLYIMMGRELEAVDNVRAGHIFAIKGLEGKVWRSATLVASHNGTIKEGSVFPSKDMVVNLGSVNLFAAPIVRVALEPDIPADMPKLVTGLRLLSQSDPCVQTFQQPTGEHVILTAGELHLERCLKDLRERFARIDIQASKPIVPFRETAVKGVEMVPPKTAGASRGTMKGGSSQDLVKFTIKALPLPKTISQVLLDHVLILKSLKIGSSGDTGIQNGFTSSEGEIGLHDGLLGQSTVSPEHFWTLLRAACNDAGEAWAGVADRIWAFGPQKAGACLLIDSRKSFADHSFSGHKSSNDIHTITEDPAHIFDDYVETGFQLATFQGPLCAEPMEGMAFFVEDMDIDEASIENEREQNRILQVTSSLTTSVRDACRNGLLDWSPRLMLAMYACDIQASTDVLGKVYAVVAKRRGRIVAEEMKEGTSFFNVSALLPVVESFGFADDIRKKTSGAASPQLIFKGYELLDQDPFWVPTTEEELEDLGEKSDRTNVAKAYMDAVRERKGMFVDRKIVEFAEKQRTLKR